MQGTIVKVLVARGRRPSSPARRVLVLEAMKMENHINAETGGTVARGPRRAPATRVGTGDVLIVIE